MRKLARKMVVGIMTGVMLFGCLTLGGCGKKEEQSVYEKIQKDGKLVVGMNAEFAPFEFHMNVDGEDQVVGLDISLAEQIAKDLGVELEIKEMEFDPLIQNLKAGQVDVVISALVPSEERKQQVDFSDVYFSDSNVALINANKASEYKSIDDLKGARICYQLGSYQEDVTKQVFGEDNLTVLDSTNTILLALKADQIDAFITSKTVAEQAMAADKDYSYVESDTLRTEEDGCAVAIPKGEEELQKAINDTIKRLTDSGEMDQYVKDACELAAKNVEE
ncbi:MAG: transporter substrate-binding domain-containing protein [Lachnospiraceae bacterium]|nr:transporter substrate-binding domain-containing protein [Lachnospiraceae bacterium]